MSENNRRRARGSLQWLVNQRETLLMGRVLQVQEGAGHLGSFSHSGQEDRIRALWVEGNCVADSAVPEPGVT